MDIDKTIIKKNYSTQQYCHVNFCSHSLIKWKKIESFLKLFTCTEFNNTRYYIIHYRKVHKCLPEEFKDRKQFMCDQCPDVFLSEHNLR